MSETIDLWQGRFGDEYQQRNRINWHERIPFWESAMDFTQATSVLEVGCGPGWNLLAIRQVAPSTDLYGVDVNAGAVEEARQQGINAQRVDALGILALFDRGSVDMVFTAGMLIHVGPQDIDAVMRAIVATSGRYVLSIEYESEQVEEVDYRGHKGRLWKRPYGEMYKALGLRLLSVGEAGGFDNCQYALLDKGQDSEENLDGGVPAASGPQMVEEVVGTVKTGRLR